LSNSIHPTAVIDPRVSLGFGNTIGAYTIITGFVTLGNENWIGPHVVIGSPPEHRLSRKSSIFKFTEKINIGSNNIIHEFATIQAPVGEVTLIGDNNFIMNKVHVAHDCYIGNNTNISSGALIGGNVTIANLANVGLGAIIHQLITIPTLCMVGMGAVVTRNPPPYTTIVGSPASVIGINKVGIEKAGYELSDLQFASLRRCLIEKDLSFLSNLPQSITQVIESYEVNLL
jgi:UDP-N-acetylglucosamine acyltransferase